MFSLNKNIINLFSICLISILIIISSQNMDKFTSDDIVKDMNIKAPHEMLKIVYGSIEVHPGQILTPTQVKNAPSVSWKADTNAYYLLIMNDPDAPSRKNPKMREWHHWMVGNIPGGDLAKGDTLSQYVGSGPPKDTGLHRYVFLLYKQPSGKVDYSEHGHLTNRSPNGRGKHSAHKFAEKYSLGNPVAGNYYQAEYDDWVPEVHKMLSGE